MHVDVYIFYCSLNALNIFYCSMNALYIFYCSMNALMLAAILLVVCVALAPLIDALEAEDEEVVCHY